MAASCVGTGCGVRLKAYRKNYFHIVSLIFQSNIEQLNKYILISYVLKMEPHAKEEPMIDHQKLLLHKKKIYIFYLLARIGF